MRPMQPFTKEELAKIEAWQRLRDDGYSGKTGDSAKFSNEMTLMNGKRKNARKRAKAVERTLRYRARHPNRYRKYMRNYMKIVMRAKRDAIKASKGFADCA